MEKTAETKKEMRLKAWVEMYSEYQNGGMTVTAWCEERGLPVKTFYYRLHKLREAVLEQTETHQIVPIAANLEIPSSQEHSIKISSNEITVELPESISAETITAVLRGLR